MLEGEIVNNTFLKDSFQPLNNEYLQNIIGGSKRDYRIGYKLGKATREALEIWSLFK
ncbi:hypothetical protein [Lactiplantibacillus pentosus]|uniref:hypothetical protein n=1 Tax=Lactiplantibacillus pentosus TaxID=1589 RepID=UPI0028BD8323|nr:hypothetical protein [Lactiplantibacillus pentosus]